MAKLPTGRYVIVETTGYSGIVNGSAIDSMRVKEEIADGVYPDGTIIMHVVSGRLFRVRTTPIAIAFGDLTTRQRSRAEKYRRDWWPNPQQRPRPRFRK